MKTYEFTGKNVEKAIENGLAQLNKSKYDVEIKILESGGLFRKAKVQILVDEEDYTNKESITEKIDEILKDQKKVPKEKPTKKDENSASVNEDVKEEKPAKKEEKSKKKKEEKINTTKAVEAEIVEEKNAIDELANLDDDLEDLEETSKDKKRKLVNNKGSKKFIEGLLKQLNIDGTVEILEEETHSKALISTDRAGAIIGHRGETLASLQYLSNIVEQRQNRYAKRLIVDVGDYRDRRDDSLKDLADRMARKVLKYKTAVKLKPMNAYDRRIVHTYLQNFKGVTTHSEGVEPNRCLIIDVKRD